MQFTKFLSVTVAAALAVSTALAQDWGCGGYDYGCGGYDYGGYDYGHNVTPPSNDNYASAWGIYGASGSISGSNAGAAMEPWEPIPTDVGSSDYATGSVWFQWTAPFSGLATFNTLGSSFDTVLAAYDSSFTEQASNDQLYDGQYYNQSSISFSVVSGTTYLIVVYGWWYDEGNYTLNWLLEPAPSNDYYASAWGIYGASGTMYDHNKGTTMEPWEPRPSACWDGATGSVWFQWTAPSTGRATFSTVGSDFDTVLAAYDSVFTEQASIDSYYDDSMSFPVFAGTTYLIAVYGRYGDSGAIVLNWLLDTANPVSGRFDGDGCDDIALFSSGTWTIKGSYAGRYSATFGSGDCIPVPADYDGDGRADLSVYDTVTGDWWIQYSSGGWTQDNFGSLTCKPYPADYDGDGKADLSVWDGQTGDWFIRYSNGGWTQDNFGSLSCIPTPADYDGDGKADLSVRDSATGDWWIRYSSGLGPNGMSWSGDNFGSTACTPYPADYDGDDKADLSVYDQTTGDWFVRYSGGGWTQDNFGMKTCIPCPADYDGDGKADFAVFDIATFTFWVRYSGGGWTSVVF